MRKEYTEFIANIIIGCLVFIIAKFMGTEYALAVIGYFLARLLK